MSNTEENRVEYLEERLKNEKKQYDQLKIITMVLGVFAIAFLGWGIYSTFFSSDNEAFTPEGLQENPYVLELKDSIYNLSSQLVDLEITNEDNMENMGTGDGGSLGDQIIYSIQIGAFEQKDLSLYSESFTNFKEIKQGRFNKYSIGNFENLHEAQELLTEITSMGLRDAFIASYANGERLKIEDPY